MRFSARGSYIGKLLTKVTEGGARTDWRELPGVTDEPHHRLRSHRIQQDGEQLGVEHRAFVHEQEVRVDRATGLPLAGDDVEHPMNSSRYYSWKLALKNRSGSSSRGARPHEQARLRRGRGQRPAEPGLAGAR